MYITITTDGAGNNPGSAARVASYTITFPGAGTYQLYGRVLVGPNTFNDDSLFYASSFGTKSPTLNSDWVLVNGLASAGFSNSTDEVTGGGSLGSGMWKWINLSQFTSQSGLVVSAGNLTQTFQIGGRENGLDLDKFVFGTAGTAFTVSNLDTGTLPPPATTANTNVYNGPDGVALHRFSGLNSGLNLDGANPSAGLVFSGGVLFGTTLNGGTQGGGTMFTMSLDGTHFVTLRPFTNAPDVANPQTDLASSGGGFFGSTIAGGNNGVGTLFSANTNGTISILESFSMVSADNATNSGGASPSGLLALSGPTLFGTATAGGANANGTIFSISTNGPAFTALHDFSLLDSNTGTNADGARPCGGLISAGNTLFGTASAGGTGGAGVVFSLNQAGGDFSVLHDFTPLDPMTATNSDGAFPMAGLSFSNGVLYGTTVAGGTGGQGVVYSIRTDGTGFTVVHSFSVIDPAAGTNADGAAPCAPVALSGNCLYGTTPVGGANGSGTVFSLASGGGQFQVLHTFTATDRATATKPRRRISGGRVIAVGKFAVWDRVRRRTGRRGHRVRRGHAGDGGQYRARRRRQHNAVLSRRTKFHKRNPIHCQPGNASVGQHFHQCC